MEQFTNHNKGEARPSAGPSAPESLPIPGSPTALLEWVKNKNPLPSLGEEKLRQAVEAGLLIEEIEPDETYE